VLGWTAVQIWWVARTGRSKWSWPPRVSAGQCRSPGRFPRSG